MKITAVGDVLIQRPYSTDYADFKTLKDYIMKGDVRFFNLETTLNREGSCYGGNFSGGSYLRAEPEALDTALSYGFNLLSNNNNHAFDFDMKGFTDTLDVIEKSGVPFAGTGRDLPSASRPAYLDTKDGKAALISVCASFTPPSPAGNPTDIYPGRPGINPLNYSTTICVTKKQADVLKEIADETGVNRRAEIARKEGYQPPLPENVFEFSSLKLKIADKCGTETTLSKKDMARILDSIKEAKQNADFVILSLHNHCVTGEKEDVPEFLREFCHIVIENGVGAVICHGPHLLRGLEIYNGAPIFHSLGDFVLELSNIQSAPADFYEKCGVSTDKTIKELLDIRSNGGKRGLMFDRRMFCTVIPYFEVKDGRVTSLEMLPVELGFDETDDRRGIPLVAKDLYFVDKFKELSEVFGTKMSLQNGIIKVEL